MGAPESGMHAAEQPGADELLGAFKRIGADERRQHEAVLNYWLSIRGDKEFPPLHDLDPLELSDAAPSSILLELLSGGHDAEIRHLGEALKGHVDVERIIDAAHPSLLSSIAKKLPIVAISRDFLAFEDEYAGVHGKTRCWVTLLPLSAGGAWVDYVYALVSLATEESAAPDPAKKSVKKAEAPEPPVAEAPEAEVAVEAPEAEVAVEAPEVEVAVEAPEAEVAVEEPGTAEETVAEALEPIEAEPEVEAAAAPEANLDQVFEAEVEEAPEAIEGEDPEGAAMEAVPETAVAESASQPELAEAAAEQPEPESGTAENEGQEADEPAAPAAKGVPGFAKLFDSLAGLTGFYGSQPVRLEPVIEEPVDEAPAGGAIAEEPVGNEPAAQEPVEGAPVAEEPTDAQAAPETVIEQPAAEAPAAEDQLVPAMEGSLQSKLSDVRAKADEARQARLRATAVLCEGLSAAYDFALDAEEAPEEYLKLVEAQGLKIQLRAPMKPVVKLAFDGLCDEATIAQLEAVLAWALKEELPRGSLKERIDAAGGISGLIEKKAA